ncbi:MAG: hypothetical protein J5I90_15060 [Caldilineales bacterium]|nr:hypothetical protein [Caldilineales bacterium]
MKSTHLIAAGLIAASTPAIYRRLQARHRWEQHNRRAYLAIDFAQASAAATRAGLPLYDFLHECRHRGATHIAIAEDTLDSLLQRGELVQMLADAPGQHHFVSSRPALITRLRDEFAARLPHVLIASSATPDPATHLVLQGDLAALRPLALGFDPDLFKLARSTGLQLIASPASYAWPTPAAIERTLAQAAQLGARIIRFAGDPLLGHEMWLQHTVASLRKHRLTFAFFVDSRHQRGDWFIAKTLPEQTLLSYRFTPAQLDASDIDGLAYQAGLRAREGGIRLIFADADIGVHAYKPTDLHQFLGALAHDLTGHGGFILDIPDHSHEHADPDHGHDHDESGHHHEHAESSIPDILPVERITVQIARALELMSSEPLPARVERRLLLPSAVGLGLLALENMRSISLPVALLAGGSAFIAANVLLPRLDRPRDALTTAFTPSYTPKLVGLGALVAGAASGPAGLIAAPVAGLLTAAETSNPEYYLRVETLRTYNLDWSLPLAWQFLAEPLPMLNGWQRWPVAAAIALTPVLLRGRIPADLISQLDQEHPSGHTHHLSAAQRTLGDARMAASAQPLRKWSGLTLMWLIHAGLPAGSSARSLAGLVATAGGIAAAGTLRNAGRPITLSIAQVIRSSTILSPVALAGAALAQARKSA